MSSLASHRVVASEEEEEDEHITEVEVDSDYIAKIKVIQSPGYLCHITASITLKVAPKALYQQCLVHPDNAAIYRHMDRCSFRRVLSACDANDGGTSISTSTTTFSPDGSSSSNARRRIIQVAHEASWHFLFFHGKFVTHLLVEEDHENLAMKFQLLPRGSSIVSKFQGEWKIVPHPTDPHSSISILEQDIAIAGWYPPPLDKLFKSISCRQVRRIVEDLQAEAKKINAGRPTLCPYDAVKDKSIGNEPEDGVVVEHAAEVMRTML